MHNLGFYLFNHKILWKINAGYGQPKREILIYLKSKDIIKLDLLNKTVLLNNLVFDIGQYISGNPIAEMLMNIEFKGNKINEKWSDEIKLFPKEKHGELLIYPQE